MGGIECSSDLFDDPHRLRRLERPLAQRLLQVSALDQAHRDVQLPVDLAGVWIGTTFGCSSDAATRDSVRNRSRNDTSPGEVRREQLERDVTVEREIACAVHHAHPAAADQRFQPVAGELRPDARIR